MVILAIGGYDPTSGAGISADIKTAHTLGVYCPTITTSVIPQNNKMVYEKFDLPEENIKNQFKAVLRSLILNMLRLEF